ncbi:MAG: hypothetical protein KDN19_19190, partial [Verrucomicrobiae bacterium]|nr:hypothetical protein [Verrucomicrobiae bacterium]
HFGSSVAMDEHRVVVGAYDHNSSGALYVFDFETGDQLLKLVASDPSAGQYLGLNVALCGPRVLAGAYGDQIAQGAGYLFDITEAGPVVNEVRKFVDPDGGSLDSLGRSVALSGDYAILGAPNDEGADMKSGTVHLFDCQDGGWVGSFFPIDGATNDAFGWALATSGSMVFVGGRYLFSQKGAGYLFDLNGQEWGKLTAPDGESGDFFGTVVALCGNVAVVGAYADNAIATDSGSAYVFSPVAGPLPLVSVAKTRDFAPGVPEASFRAFGNAFINNNGAVTFDARLAGPGASRGRTQGIWTNVSNVSSTPVSLLALRRQILSDAIFNFIPPMSEQQPIVQSVGTAFSNQGQRGLLELRASGGEFNRRSGVVLNQFDGSALEMIQTTGDVDYAGYGDPVSRIHESVQTHTESGGSAINVSLIRGGAITAENDSGLILFDDAGDLVGSGLLEGDNIPFSSPLKWGQFASRLSQGGASKAVYTAYVTGGGTPFQRVFSNLLEAISQGDSTAILAGAEVRSAVTEIGTQPNGTALARVTLSGAGVNRANNEAIYSGAFGEVALRKGDPVPGEAAGVVWNRFLGFWPVDEDRFIVLAKLRGPGVNGRNDCALYLWQEDQSFLKLVREGDPVCDCDCPAVGRILRVDVNPVSGDYAVLTSLVGGNRRANQALLTGAADAGNATTEKIFRLPHLRLRKGTLYAADGGAGTTGIRSITMTPTVDRGGAGGKGRGQVINNDGEIVVCVTFDDRSKELLSGQPGRGAPVPE